MQIFWLGCWCLWVGAFGGPNEEKGKVTVTTTAVQDDASDDPFLWLEDVAGDAALDWVRGKNALTQSHFESDPSFQALQSDLLAILDSSARIPMVSKRGEYYYNFWRDKKNVRGIWRRTTLDQYRKAEPQWEVLLDLDEIADQEHENWVWKGASLLRPDYRRCLITLSRGGADASIVREFDMTTRQFVADGFQLPESKGGMTWIDQDHVYVATDFGPGSMTTSGYPRIAKRWKRGTPLEQAEVIYEGQPEDMSVSASFDDSPGFERHFVSRAIRFYYDELFLVTDAGLVKVDAPNSANKSVHREFFYVELREPWQVGGLTYAAGSLLAIPFERFMQGSTDFAVLFTPTENSSLAGFSPTKDHVILNVLEDVKNKLFVLTPGQKGWSKQPLQGAPAIGTVSAGPVDSDESNAYFMTVNDYLTPTTLALGEIGADPERLKSLPAMYNADGLEVTQHFAVSQDGTKVPYFQVSRQGLELNGQHPTLLYGYGGFEISLTPSYNPVVGRAWTSQGGVYVVANIRGGGEYGPRWHQAALKENRLRAYEDFAAVAEDLVRRRVTKPEKLGIQGGSNGGLLVGNMVALYPKLFEAAVCQVPLLDMRRYHQLLAGASWMAEYGNPDDPKQWSYIQKFSPYQNIRPDVKYPEVLFTTSTRDDRVHPGHARKMFARMEQQGHAVRYFENIEGGHGGAANNGQTAYMQALAFRFLSEKLVGSAR
ncbi:MAG: prolyl oligopeptidase family serine peptidase [Pirellulaceae bacterium]|nr:prolyl oligopeptidase family serine peptidase [Pirellulaceae bacterium]